MHLLKRASVNTVDGVDTTISTTSMGMDIRGVGILATIITTPDVIRLDILALVFGIICVASKYVNRIISVQNNDAIRDLAEQKLKTLNGRVSGQEFRLTLDDIFKYNNKTWTGIGAVTSIPQLQRLLCDHTANFFVKRERSDAREFAYASSQFHGVFWQFRGFVMFLWLHPSENRTRAGA